MTEEETIQEWRVWYSFLFYFKSDKTAQICVDFHKGLKDKVGKKKALHEKKKYSAGNFLALFPLWRYPTGIAVLQPCVLSQWNTDGEKPGVHKLGIFTVQISAGFSVVLGP